MAVLCGALAAVSCSGSPTRSTPVAQTPQAGGGAVALRVDAGPHVLIVTGNTIGGGCSAIPGGATAVAIAAQMVVERDGGDWVARPASPGTGDMRVRFRASGTDTAIAVGVIGTATGVLTDASSPLGAPAGVRLALDGQAELVGEQLKGATPIVGEARGSIRFGEPERALTTCTKVSWSLGPAGGP